MAIDTPHMVQRLRGASNEQCTTRLGSNGAERRQKPWRMPAKTCELEPGVLFPAEITNRTDRRLGADDEGRGFSQELLHHLVEHVTTNLCRIRRNVEQEERRSPGR